MPLRSWRFHTTRILLLTLVTALLGWAIGHPWLTLLAAAVSYLGWQGINLWRLYRWVKDPASDIPQSFGIWADIYDGISIMDVRNRRQKEKYRSMIDEFRSLTSALPDATLVIDENDVITWFNHAAETLLDLQNPGDLGQPVTNLIRETRFADWLAVQGVVQSPLEMASPRGNRRWLTVIAVPYRKTQRLLILHDTTEVHHLDKIRRDFVANISHELRTPLTVVQGYLEMLDSYPADEVAVAVSKMLQQTGHMQSLLDDLLELSRVQSGEIKGDEDVVNVAALLMQLKEQAEELSAGRHELSFEVAPDTGLNGVASDLESAFGNLISNAIKYTAEGRSIAVRWSNSDEGPRFDVKDEGIGIPTRDISRITERFYRVGSGRGQKTGGTGLGLAIVKHVVNAHGAELLIHSELGEGSTFSILFPAERLRILTNGSSNDFGTESAGDER